MIRRLALVALAFLSIAAGDDPADRLKDPAQEARARAMFREVRCLVCQNESIDDSEAEIARDLRKVVRQQVTAGKDDASIKRFLVERYGEFVLLRPAFSLGNAALWGAPVAVILIGGTLLFFLLRRKEETALTALDAEEEAKLRALLEE